MKQLLFVAIFTFLGAFIAFVIAKTFPSGYFYLDFLTLLIPAMIADIIGAPRTQELIILLFAIVEFAIVGTLIGYFLFRKLFGKSS